ncbi:MAG: transcriptional regulator [Pseudonocardiales bacterium]|nr:MAG: transcriptional regulator [Pseudonocardiales bacterium]
MVNPPGYTPDKARLLSRLARAEGQVRGLSQMVEQDRYCIDILTQIAAARAALDAVALQLLDGHARRCLTSPGPHTADPHARADELMGAVSRLLRSR